jgi:hypothetical protein
MSATPPTLDAFTDWVLTMHGATFDAMDTTEGNTYRAHLASFARTNTALQLLNEFKAAHPTSPSEGSGDSEPLSLLVEVNEQRQTTTPSEPTIQRNTFPQRDCELTKLPFVEFVKTSPGGEKLNLWCVPSVDCYARANIIGAQYAADLIQYTKDNPDEAAGLLGWVANGMREAPSRGDASHGIEVGFWALVERSLKHKGGRFDHYGAAEAMAQRITELVDAAHG